MESVKIFLASSDELKPERKAFEDFLYQKTKLWRKEKSIFLELVNWEDFIDTMSATGLQDKYNEAIKECDIFVMLFWTKVGQYTHEEFETAWQYFLTNGKPLILTYFKNESAHTIDHDSLNTFMNRLDELHHYKTMCRTIDEILLHFNFQLDKLYSMNGSKETENSSQKTKDQLFDMIHKGELFEALDKLNLIFNGSNDVLNALIGEFTSPPGNFSLAHYTGRLKMFISNNLKP